MAQGIRIFDYLTDSEIMNSTTTTYSVVETFTVPANTSASCNYNIPSDLELFAHTFPVGTPDPNLDYKLAEVNADRLNIRTVWTRLRPGPTYQSAGFSTGETINYSTFYLLPQPDNIIGFNESTDLIFYYISTNQQIISGYEQVYVDPSAPHRHWYAGITFNDPTGVTNNYHHIFYIDFETEAGDPDLLALNKKPSVIRGEMRSQNPPPFGPTGRLPLPNELPNLWNTYVEESFASQIWVTIDSDYDYISNPVGVDAYVHKGNIETQVIVMVK